MCDDDEDNGVDGILTAASAAGGGDEGFKADDGIHGGATAELLPSV